MDTNALPQSGGVPLRAQPSYPYEPEPTTYRAPEPEPVYQPPQPAVPATYNNPPAVNQPGVGPRGADRYIPGPTPVPAQPAAPEQYIVNNKPPEQQLKEAIGHASDTLLVATTVFPFTLFPDTITIDRSKLTVTKRFFFAISETFSIRIEDILNVTADTGPFFGSVQITTRFFANEKKPYDVNYLWRSDALRIKRILLGYIIATTKNIDCSSMDAKKLAKMLDDLGKGAPVD